MLGWRELHDPCYKNDSVECFNAICDNYLSSSETKEWIPLSMNI